MVRILKEMSLECHCKNSLDPFVGYLSSNRQWMENQLFFICFQKKEEKFTKNDYYWIDSNVGLKYDLYAMIRYVPFLSILTKSMPPIAVFACCTSLKSSDAIARCLSNGWLSGDSIIGSIGSNGLIKCAKIQIFGSDTSKTLNGPCALTSTESHGGGSFRIKSFEIELHSN